VSFYANISGVYAAFQKKWDPRAIKRLTLRPIEIINNNKENFVYNTNSISIADKIEVDILYLDPPYNERQYASYYHVLETIARYDNPAVKGKTKMRNWTNQKSKWCIKKSAKEELEEVIKNAPQNHIYLSYNNEGIISFEDIKEVFEKYGEYTVFEREYNRYKADKNREYESDKTIEYIHYCHKSE
jgi:adenine-specific DNA-methyltransferase